MNTSIYLSQSYQDAWSDYKRSINSPSFPTWDYVILTASNEHQAQAFQLQIEARKEASMTHPGQSGETESVVLKDVSVHERSRRR